jgi:hypothetical protein
MIIKKAWLGSRLVFIWLDGRAGKVGFLENLNLVWYEGRWILRAFRVGLVGFGRRIAFHRFNNEAPAA